MFDFSTLKNPYTPSTLNREALTHRATEDMALHEGRPPDAAAWTSALGFIVEGLGLWGLRFRALGCLRVSWISVLALWAFGIPLLLRLVSLFSFKGFCRSCRVGGGVIRAIHDPL